MENSTKKAITIQVIFWSVMAICIGVIVLITVFQVPLFSSQSVFARWVADLESKTPLDGDGNHLPLNANTKYFIGTALPAVFVTIEIIAICVISGMVLHLVSKIRLKNQKAITVLKLICNFFKWAIAIAGLFCIMSAFGLSSQLAAAAAGVLALIIGLGSQTLVADILAGIFIVFEGDFQVGDIIIVDGWRGEVLSIGIRTTKLLDAGGNVKIVSNSEIKSIINQTKELSLAKCYVAISYDDRIEKIESVIADNIEAIKEKIPDIVEGPYYKGVSELAESSVNLLFVAKCKEGDIYQVERDLNREIKIMFDNNGINIPFNQLVVHMGKDDTPSTITQREIKKAEEFAKEQKELSKSIDIKPSDE